MVFSYFGIFKIKMAVIKKVKKSYAFRDKKLQYIGVDILLKRKH